MRGILLCVSLLLRFSSNWLDSPAAASTSIPYSVVTSPLPLLLPCLRCCQLASQWWSHGTRAYFVSIHIYLYGWVWFVYRTHITGRSVVEWKWLSFGVFGAAQQLSTVGRLLALLLLMMTMMTDSNCGTLVTTEWWCYEGGLHADTEWRQRYV